MMFSTNELKRVYGIAIGLLVIAAASYAAFPSKSPERPIRIAFQTVAGKVIFDHNRHWVESGYSCSCGSVITPCRPRSIPRLAPAPNATPWTTMTKMSSNVRMPSTNSASAAIVNTAPDQRNAPSAM